jgi:hypothetical protein
MYKSPTALNFKEICRFMKTLAEADSIRLLHSENPIIFLYFTIDF